MRARYLITLAMVTSMSLAPTGLLAQTATGSPPTTQAPSPAGETEGLAPEPVIKENLFTVTPVLETDLTADAAPVSLSFAGQPNTTQQIDLSGIAAQGFSRTVTVNGESIGQVVVTKLTKDENSVDLTADKFTSQFTLDSNRLVPTTSISVNGDEAEFVRAVATLTKEEASKEEPEEVEDKASDGTDSGEATGKGDNDIADGYETPQRIEAQEEEDPKIEVRTTSEGCSPVVDLAQGVVRMQSKTQTFSDGTLTEEGACSDSGMSYTIQKSYNVCEDVVDLDGLKVNPQYMSYYINDASERINVSDCMVDEEKTFPITENENCAVTINIEDGNVIVNTSLVYLNDSNKEIRVRDCQPSETIEPIALLEDTHSCTMKHDFSAGQSNEMVMYSYEKDGVRYQATPCIDSGNSYNHTKVFEKNGIRVCPMLVNRATNTATPQYRTEITVNGESQYIDECKPEASSAVGIFSTTDGCDNPSNFAHDLAAGVSYGLERFYYDIGGSSARTFITECTKSDQAYTHDVTPTGWKYDDENKTAQQLVTVSINVNGTTYPIATNYLAAGTTAVPYSYVGTKDVRNEAAARFEGCNKFIPTKRSEIYTRPDGTEYAIPIGAGEDIDDGDKCVREVETKDEYTHAEVKGAGMYATRFIYFEDGTRQQVGLGTITDMSKFPAKYVSVGNIRCPKRAGQTNSGSMQLSTYKGRYGRTRITMPDGGVSYSDWTLQSEYVDGVLVANRTISYHDCH